MSNLQNLIKKWKRKHKKLSKQIDEMFYSHILGEKSEEIAALIGFKTGINVCINDLNKVLKEKEVKK